jgi:CRP-like cAMP-binding protein
LIQLASSDHEAEAGVQLEVSQHDLSVLVGASREKVNRQLGTWQRAGLLELGKCRVIIRDVNGLKDFI